MDVSTSCAPGHARMACLGCVMLGDDRNESSTLENETQAE